MPTGMPIICHIVFFSTQWRGLGSKSQPFSTAYDKGVKIFQSSICQNISQGFSWNLQKKPCFFLQHEVYCKSSGGRLSSMSTPLKPLHKSVIYTRTPKGWLMDTPYCNS